MPVAILLCLVACGESGGGALKETIVPDQPILGAPSSPITLELVVLNARPPTKDDIPIRVIVNTLQDADDVTVDLSVANELLIAHGLSNWTGDLRIGEPVSLDYNLRALQVGSWEVSAFAQWFFTDDSSYGDRKAICILTPEADEVVDFTRGRCPSSSVIPPGFQESKPTRD